MNSLSECYEPQTLYTGLVSGYKTISDELEPVKSKIVTIRPKNSRFDKEAAELMLNKHKAGQLCQKTKSEDDHSKHEHITAIYKKTFAFSEIKVSQQTRE